MEEMKAVEQSWEELMDNHTDEIMVEVASHMEKGPKEEEYDPGGLAHDSTNITASLKEEQCEGKTWNSPETFQKMGTFYEAEEIFRAYGKLRADYVKKSQENASLRGEIEGFRKSLSIPPKVDVVEPAPILIGGRGGVATLTDCTKTVHDSNKHARKYFEGTL